MEVLGENNRDVTSTLMGFVDRKLRLDLSTLDLAFLGLLRLRGTESSTAAFSEEQVFDAFERACHVAEPGAENVRSRASHALRRLREQQLLIRVDSAGVTRAGEYSLSRLALGIVDFYLESQVLSRESLSPITATLAATLSELVSKVRRHAAEPGEALLPSWAAIHGTLDVTCRELLVAIERRQLGLDHQQETFQKEIATLLSADWFGSLEHCQSLLDTSAQALNELNDVLLRDTQQLHALLFELVHLLTECSGAGLLRTTPQPRGDVGEAAAFTADDGSSPLVLISSESAPEALAPDVRDADLELKIMMDKCLRASVALADQIDRVASWGAARQKAWTDYYDYVHRYLRDVVRLDPSRALSQRLRQQLVEHGVRPFALAVAAETALRVLREPELLEPPPPVRRPRKLREKELTEEAAVDDPMIALERSVREIVAEGARSLQEVTQRLTRDLGPDERFLCAGRIAEIFGRLPQSSVERERLWVAATPDLDIEQRQTRPFPFEDDHE